MSSKGNSIFNFGAEVTETALLPHLTSTTTLRALSDADIDFHTILAISVLGNHFAVESTLASTVRPHLISKTESAQQLQSEMVSNLSIGWGHARLAVELSHTQAGVNALLLIGALATGCTYSDAAKCLSELLWLHGYKAMTLPKDAVVRVVGHLAPTVRDLGFVDVLSEVTTTAVRAINGMEGPKREEVYTRLTKCGDAVEVATAVQQLMFAAKNHESVCVTTQMRGAWFAAFASDFLGMSVDLRLDGVAIWGCGGNNGAAFFELGEQDAQKYSAAQSVSGRSLLFKLSSAGACPSISVDHFIEDAFSSLMSREPRLTPELQAAIGRAIASLSLGIFNCCPLSTHFIISHETSMIRESRSIKELEKTLKAFRLDTSILSSKSPLWWRNFNPLKALQSSCLSAANSPFRLKGMCVELKSICGMHKDEPWMDGDLWPLDRIYTNAGPNQIPGGCLCSYVSSIIVGFTASVIALVQVHFDPTHLRIHEDVLVGRLQSPLFESISGRERCLHQLEIMTHLMLLTSGDCTDRVSQRQLRNMSEGCNILGLSWGSHTLCYSFIIEVEHGRDSKRQLLSLLPGRASIERRVSRLLLENVDLDRNLTKGRLYTKHTLQRALKPITKFHDLCRSGVCLTAVLGKDAIVLKGTTRKPGSGGDEIPILGCIISAIVDPNPHRPFGVE